MTKPEWLSLSLLRWKGYFLLSLIKFSSFYMTGPSAQPSFPLINISTSCSPQIQTFLVISITDYTCSCGLCGWCSSWTSTCRFPPCYSAPHSPAWGAGPQCIFCLSEWDFQLLPAKVSSYAWSELMSVSRGSYLCTWMWPGLPGCCKGNSRDYLWPKEAQGMTFVHNQFNNTLYKVSHGRKGVIR